MLEYLPLIILVVFAAIQGWKNRISVEEYKRKKRDKQLEKLTRLREEMKRDDGCEGARGAAGWYASDGGGDCGG